MAAIRFIIIVTLLFIPGRLSAFSFTPGNTYQQAIPAFFDATHEALLKIYSPEELLLIAQWEQDLRARLPEFFNDLIRISKKMEDQLSEEFVREEYGVFLNKWQPIIESFPGFEQIAPALDSLFQQLTSHLPRIITSRDLPYPLFSVDLLFQELARINPWGLGALFEKLTIQPELIERMLSEKKLIETTKGVKKELIIKRETQFFKDGVLTHYILIENDKLIDSFKLPKDPTLIHELLRLAIRDNLDPALIRGLSRIVDLIDQELLAAVNNGILDQSVYNLVYDL